MASPFPQPPAGPPQRASAADRFEAAFAHAARGMAIVALDGRIRRVNHALAALMGVPADGLEGRHVDELQARMVVLRLRDLCLERPELRTGRLQSLVDSDRDRGTSYVQTLQAFLDAFGDVRAAAEVVRVHPNTFRYRLRRLSELAGLDLDDPVERLVAHLQLDLLGP